MRRLGLLIAAAAAALLACQPAGEPSPRAAAAGAGSSTPARVDRVVDGDTLVVRLGDGRRRRVRLIGIDTPETKRPGSPVECGGPQATALMLRLALRGEGRGVRGRDVVLVGDPSQDAADRYGRWLAYVDATDGSGGNRDIGRALVEAGWARAVAFDGPFRRQAAYGVAEAHARLRGRGIWGLCRGERR